MPRQRVRVRVVRVELQRALEEADSGLVLALQTEAVAQHAPARARAEGNEVFGFWTIKMAGGNTRYRNRTENLVYQD